MGKIIISLLTICCRLCTASISEDTDRLLSNLFDPNNYKAEVHPKTADDGAIKVSLGVTPVHISVDEEAGVLHTHMWVYMSWHDDRLKWDTSGYGGIDMVHVSDEKMWRPDIKAFNGIEREQYDPIDVLIFSDGHSFWGPPINLRTSCNFTYKYWPWDTQKCKIILGSWTKSGWEMDVGNYGGDNITKLVKDFYTPTIWQLDEAYTKANQVYYYEMVEPWPDVTVHFKIRRKSFVDQKVAVLPLILASCLILAAFWTFPLSQNRINLGCLNFITLFFMLLYLRARLPMAGAEIPLIVAFCGSLFVLVTLQMLAALSINNLISRKDSPPRLIVAPLEGILGRILFLSDLPLIGTVPGHGSYTIDMEAMKIAAVTPSATTATTTTTDDAAEAGPNRAAATPTHEKISEWNLFCQAVDRVMFLLYMFIILIYVASYVGGAAG